MKKAKQIRAQLGGTIFDQLIDSNSDVVVCFDLLLTRQRIQKCKSSKELKHLAYELKTLVVLSTRGLIFGNILRLAKRDTHGKGQLLTYKSKVDFGKTIKVILIQDTIVVCHDLRKVVDVLHIDIELNTWISFICQSTQEIFDTLFARGYMARASIASGLLYADSRLVLGNPFLEAYDHIEGKKRLSMLAIEVTPSFLRMQNTIGGQLGHVPCSVGEYLKIKLYINHNGRIFLSPCVFTREIFGIRLAMLKKFGCNEKFYRATADFYISCLNLSPRTTDSFTFMTFTENDKYLDFDESDYPEQDLIETFIKWRKNNSRWVN